MENKPATLPCNTLKVPKVESNPERYLRADNWRRWELCVNYKTKIYLNDEEKDYFLGQLKLGKKVILVGEMVLTKHFDYLIPIRNKFRPLEPGEIRRN